MSLLIPYAMFVPPSNILERISDAFIALDAEWRYTYVNPRAGELLGREPRSLIGKHIWTEFPQAAGSPFQLACERAMREQVLITLEDYIEPWNRWMERRIYPSLEGLSIFFTDITERKQMQERLQEQDADLRLLLESAPDVIARYDYDLRHVYVSRAIERCGLPPEAFLGKTHAEVAAEHRIPEPFASKWNEALREVRDDGQERTIRFTFGDPDAPQVWESRISVLRERRGGVRGLLAVGREITDRIAAEAELRASEERFRTLVQATAQIVWKADEAGGGFADNESWLRFTGQSPEQAEGWGWLDAIHPEDRAPTVEARQRSISEKRVFEWEHRVRRADGEYRHMQVRAVPMLDRDGSIREWIGTHTDISDRARLEEQLRQAQKMEAVGQLAGGVAHDFNNMLQAISGFAAFLEGEVEDGTEAAEYVAEIQKASSRATEMTRQLLAFGRRQVLRARVVDIHDVVRDSERMLRRLIAENVEIETRLDPRAGQVRVDPTQMHQVLLNLALNARDAMPEGGRLVIRTTRQSVTERHRLRYPSLQDGEYVKLVVQDTGTGMDAETLAHAFEPFFTRKPQGVGTGLGLSTVEGIIRQSGGYVWAESQPGQGSAFTILLPQEADLDVRGRPSQQSDALRSGQGTVLLVEDDEMVRRVARLTLQRAGYTVLEAADGEEALQLYSEHGDRIDLLLTDVVMPKMGGKALAEALRERRPELPIIFMSGYAGSALTPEGTLLPGTSSLPKPFDPQTLAELVASVLG